MYVGLARAMINYLGSFSSRIQRGNRNACCRSKFSAEIIITQNIVRTTKRDKKSHRYPGNLLYYSCAPQVGYDYR